MKTQKERLIKTLEEALEYYESFNQKGPRPIIDLHFKMSQHDIEELIVELKTVPETSPIERKKFKSVRVLKEIMLQNGAEFPFLRTEVVRDKSIPFGKSVYQVVYQQIKYYGSPGDMCHYISENELLELEQKGMVELL